jgi:hypothetical protein
MPEQKHPFQYYAQIILLAVLLVAVYATRTIWFDRLRSSEVTVEILHPVELLSNPYPREISRNFVLDTINQGDSVRVLKTLVTGKCIALKVKTRLKKTGYILKSADIRVR